MWSRDVYLEGYKLLACLMLRCHAILGHVTLGEKDENDMGVIAGIHK